MLYANTPAGSTPMLETIKHLLTAAEICSPGKTGTMLIEIVAGKAVRPKNEGPLNKMLRDAAEHVVAGNRPWTGDVRIKLEHGKAISADVQREHEYVRL
jgi:hypothetical protein